MVLTAITTLLKSIRQNFVVSVIIILCVTPNDYVRVKSSRNPRKNIRSPVIETNMVLYLRIFFHYYCGQTFS